MVYHYDGHVQNSREDEKNRKQLKFVLLLTFLYMCAEVVGGFFANSLALWADAGHMLSDTFALSLSLFASWLSTKPADPKRTYGFMRFEILAALINGMILIAMACFIYVQAYKRLINPPDVVAPIMILVAAGGLLVNIIGLIILHKASKDNINIKGAFLHIIGDFLGSLGAVIAGLVILIWGYQYADAIISFIIASLVFYSAFNLVIKAANILLEASPSHINVECIEKKLLAIPDVKDIHDLHVWCISAKMVALSVHVVTDSKNKDSLLKEILKMLNQKFNIEHATVQIEPESF